MTQKINENNKVPHFMILWTYEKFFQKGCNLTYIMWLGDIDFCKR
jgi:hypothetical protein